MKTRMSRLSPARLIACVLMLALAALGANAENANAEGAYAKDADRGARSFYEIFLYSFKDADGDGIGDFTGAVQALDYVRDLGFGGIWLMPIAKAASYHKYDVIDYMTIDPEYGSLEDFEAFMDACHSRGIRVILDLVVNHTSDKHPWFESARKSIVIEPCGQPVCTHPQKCRAHNPYCAYYNFVKANIAPSGYTALADGWCYESVFWSGMPDLNLTNEDVRNEIARVIDFYMDKGADGFRLDAAMHFGRSQGENIEILKWINDYAKARNPNAYIVAEVWTGLNEMLPYYESGVDSLFNFAFGTSTGRTAKTLVFKGAQNSASAYEKSLVNLYATLATRAPNAVDAPFGSNHDTGRIAGFMRRDEAKIKMYAALNLTMTGCAFVYYGEELGMSGAGIDENVRAPMYWTRDAHAEGMTQGPPNMEAQKHAFAPLDEQMRDPESIYEFYKQALALRSAYPQIAYGETDSMPGIDHTDVCAIQKTYAGESICLVYNLSPDETIYVPVPEGLQIQAELHAARASADATLAGGALSCPPMSVTLLACASDTE